MDLEQLTIAHTREVVDPNMILEPILQHPLQLQSAYMEVTGAEPDFTSSHNRFHGTVDYIWYTPEVSLKLVHVKVMSVMAKRTCCLSTQIYKPCSVHALNLLQMHLKAVDHDCKDATITTNSNC